MRNPTPPSYRLHRPTGLGVVTIDGRDFYLGPHSSPASKKKYHQLIAEWTGNDGFMPSTRDMTISELLVRFLKFAKENYIDRDGRPSSEYGNFRRVARVLRQLFGKTPAREFGPVRLKAVREQMIREGWVRSSINKQVNRLRHIFRWAVEHELLDVSAWHRLQAVDGLRVGRSDAVESVPVKPVPDAWVDAVRDYVSPTVWGLIQLQRFTGMRAGEAVIMRGVDLDMTGPVWMYKPRFHKTEHHGHERTIAIGPRAQAVLKPCLKPDMSQYIFSPRDSADWHRVRKPRKTPLNQGNRPGSNRVTAPKVCPGDRFTVPAYRRAIARACEKAFGFPIELNDAAEDTPEVKKRKAEKRKQWRSEHTWHPHQLRHGTATLLRKEYGIEVARLVLGHKDAGVTLQYAEADQQKINDVMAHVG